MLIDWIKFLLASNMNTTLCNKTKLQKHYIIRTSALDQWFSTFDSWRPKNRMKHNLATHLEVQNATIIQVWATQK